jgi:alanine racemase
VSLVVGSTLGLVFKPFALTIPAKVPVKNTVSVETKSIKAASLGACFIGCVIKSNAYNIDDTDIAKTTAKIMPIVTMSLACSSSAVNLRLAIIYYSLVK